jgi:hypothetical protein
MVLLMTKGLPLICLLVSSMLFLSCSRSEKDTRTVSGNVPQQFSGTLPVRIGPEPPTTASDLHAVLNKSGGITFSWERNGVILENEKTPELSRSLFKKHDKITVRVRQGNEKGSATVVVGNGLPQISSISFFPASIHREVDMTVEPVASDPDGDEVRFDYKWSLNGKELSENSPVLKGNSFKKGDAVSLTVYPCDSEGAGPPFKTQMVIIPNAAPIFISVPPAEFSGATYSYHALANDPDGDTITYALASAPRGMAIDAKTGMITWQITPESAGAHEIEVIARDSDGAQGTQKYSLTIKLNNGSAQ